MTELLFPRFLPGQEQPESGSPPWLGAASKESQPRARAISRQAERATSGQFIEPTPVRLED
jgi:hypothetical protein